MWTFFFLSELIVHFNGVLINLKKRLWYSERIPGNQNLSFI